MLKTDQKQASKYIIYVEKFIKIKINKDTEEKYYMSQIQYVYL